MTFTKSISTLTKICFISRLMPPEILIRLFFLKRVHLEKDYGPNYFNYKFLPENIEWLYKC